MAQLLLLADSNFQNNYGDYPGRKIKDLGIKSCQSRRVAMSELASVNKGIVVVACLDMIAAEGGDRLQVSLQACPASGIGAGEDQDSAKGAGHDPDLTRPGRNCTALLGRTSLRT